MTKKTGAFGELEEPGIVRFQSPEVAHGFFIFLEGASIGGLGREVVADVALDLGADGGDFFSAEKLRDEHDTLASVVGDEWAEFRRVQGWVN